MRKKGEVEGKENKRRGGRGMMRKTETGGGREEMRKVKGERGGCGIEKNEVIGKEEKGKRKKDGEGREGRWEGGTEKAKWVEGGETGLLQ